MINFGKDILLANFKNREFLDRNSIPERRIELFIDVDAQIIHLSEDSEINKAIYILRESLHATMKAFEEEYDFFKPEFVIKMDNKVGFVMFMKKKEDHSSDEK